MIALYADRHYLPASSPHCVLLYPFWGKNAEDPANPNSGRYDHYARTGSEHFALGALEEADLAVLPFDWTEAAHSPEAAHLAHQLAARARAAGKRLVVFYPDDATAPVPLDNALVFRTSLLRSRRAKNEFVLPGWSEDFVERYSGGEVQLRRKRTRPVVGYCGYDALCRTNGGWKARLRLRLGATPVLPKLAHSVGIELTRHPLPWLYGSRVRSQALYILAESPRIACNFLLRDRLHHSESLALEARRQFVANMLNSDYILCARGGGNFSYRFYETLSCGRIPVLIDTDCELPFGRWIDWQRYCVWVKEDDLPHIAERIEAFHARLSPREFSQLQLACRRLWVEWLSPTGFFANFHRHCP
ncbi:exostosin domain-containing protein [Gloeobacter kilaueensis]|uniref:Exostosin GT47 domain-containing protein n=1 Tax=Gloeobacter kilaueensis (strain ATCC BAA-2537 / CCAP 1431/1 / ULC 316 / JS1) TaxID=1183438 RepID=U5QI78_GLOK1|nr:exostosin family protein [Gloeobacter kilaueensis]AGY58646.1 hypothetical protein GKIL_2400 [Gloeobacter kilaueensis JS1]